MSNNLPQVLVLMLLMLELGVHLALHGEPRRGASAKYHVGWPLVTSVVAVALLWWGGFFDGLFGC